MAPVDASERYTGRAFTQDGRLAYTETHWRYQHDGLWKRLVLYRCPEGAPFARKQVVAYGNPSTPSFDFIDGRDGYREGVRGSGTDRSAYWQASRRQATREQAIRVADSSVIDAGFDPWVQNHWGTLVAYSAARGRFLIPSRGQFLPVRLTRQRGDDADRIQFRLGWDSWIGFAAPSVRLVYRASDRRLLEFDGIGSIRTADGKPWPVRIEFPLALQANAFSRDEVREAEVVALTGKCG